MINNYNLILPLLKFESENDFYFIQLFKRRKDNPDMKQDMSLVDNFFVYSLDDFSRYMEKIIQICDRENARAYIRLNRRNAERVALRTLKKLAELIESKNPKQAKSCYLSACGECNSETDKTWVVDVDNTSDVKDGLEADLYHLQKETGREPLLTKIPTKNGNHLITRPFRKDKFHAIYTDIDVHTDNPTILYCP